jgi:penicillin-binding protein 2
MMDKSTLKDHIRESGLFSSRLIAISLLICCLVVALVCRLCFLQILHQDRYKTLSRQNRFAIIPINPNRGLIYDRNGVLLATNVPAFNLEIVPSRAKHLKKTIAELKKVLPISKEDIKSFYKQRHQRRPFDSVPLKVNLTMKEMALFAINKYRFPGVEIKARLIRQYPLGSTMAHVIGYVGRINEKELATVDNSNYSNTNFIGKVGVEKFYEGILHGQTGYEQVETNASGRIIRTIQRIPPVPGRNLKLSIDANLQKAASEAFGDEHGAMVAIDPRTGEILAMVSKPTYDPNDFVQGLTPKEYKEYAHSPSQPLYNRAIRGLYPLASTIKPFLALEGLNSKTVTPRQRVFDPGWFKLPNSRIVFRTWKKGGHGWVNLSRAIIVSNDTYFYTLAAMMGIKHIDKILTAFGFGKLTGVDMGEELSGVVASPKWKKRVKGVSWYPGDTVNAGIGQGFMLTTPLQLASATATLAARGVRFRPHLVTEMFGGDTSPVNIAPTHLKPVVLRSENIWNVIVRAMVGVVTSGEGTGYRFGRHPPYSVAVKTGTAQVFSDKGVRIDEDAEALPYHLRDHTLFIAFAPVSNPKIAIGVVVEHSKRASNVARYFMDYYFNHHVKEKEKSHEPVRP